MKNGHLKVHTQNTVKHSYSPETGFINITCVLLTVRYWKRLPDNILKLKDWFLLRSFYLVKVLYLIHFIVPFSSIILMTIPIFSDTRVFAVFCIKYVPSTHEAHP